MNLLTVFDAVMRERSLTKAASRIGMSQPAVSDAVSRLRFLFKDDLFIRTGHGVRPTAKAKHYSISIRQILDQVILLLSETSSFDFVTSTRSFNIVLGDYGELVVLPRLMRWLDENNSKVTVNIRSSEQPDICDAMRTGKMDLCLSPEPIIEEGFSNQCVVIEHLMSMVRADNPLVGNKITLDKFLSLSHVILQWSDPKGSIVEQWLRAQGKSRDRHMEVHSFFDMPRVVASTNMICSVPSQMAVHFSRAHKLKVFPVPIPDLEVPFFINWSNCSELDTGNVWLRSVLVDLFAEKV